MGPAKIFTWFAIPLPVAKYMIAWVPPTILLAVVQKPYPPINHRGRAANHMRAHCDIYDPGVEPLPARLKRKIESIKQLICILNMHSFLR